MSKKILLLDCSKKLYTRLKSQGFDVETGSLGYATGVKKLPRPVYEYDIFVYNPTNFRKEIVTDFGLSIEDKSPEYSVSEINRHISRGAIILAFVNHVTDNIRHLNQIYDWIPDMPQIESTKDYKINTDYLLDWVKPIAVTPEVTIPIVTKLVSNFSSKVTWKNPFYYNNNHEVLGTNYSINNGRVIIVPSYKSNENIITIFLNRSIKKLFDDTNSNLIDLFRSSEEQKIENEIVSIGESIKTLESELEKSNEELATATRTKVNTISSDETSKLIINYYKLATDQEDSAIFYLYKIIDALKKKFGEKEAKNILKCNKDFNLIGTLANQSYADVRHAPYPEEKIKELTTSEIEACFTSAITIINSYFEHLFSNKSATTATK